MRASVHTHWLFGHGPNKELKFNVFVLKESSCGECLHNKVCDHIMEKRCVNYEFATSEHTSCAGCIHRFTRFDKDDTKIPCFRCPDFRRKL